MSSITPFLWFDTDLAAPVEFYTSVFPDTSVGDVQAAGDGGPILTATITLCGQQIMLLNGGPMHAGFTEAISLFVNVGTQAEVEDLWERLLAGGGQPGQCGWLKDRYGLSWQVVPSMLGTVLSSPDRRRAQQAMTRCCRWASLTSPFSKRPTIVDRRHTLAFHAATKLWVRGVRHGPDAGMVRGRHPSAHRVPDRTQPRTHPGR